MASGITLDADQNKEFVEDQLKQEALKNGEIPDSISNISRRKIKEVYIPPEELDRLKIEYSRVVVQDFEDDYHNTKEEREAMRQRYEKFFHLKRNFTKKIRRLDKYIEACRLTIEIVQDIAKTNGVMDVDEFITDVLRGKITINGLTIPKYQGKGRKTLNWDYIMEYILDPSRDIADIINNQDTSRCKEAEEIVDDSIPEDNMTLEDLEALYKLIDSNERPNLSYYDGSNGEGYATVESDKERKALVKVCPIYTKKLKAMYDQQTRDKSYLWQLQQSDLDWIREFKEEASRKNGDEKPEFTGSIMDEEAVARYLFELEEWEKDHELVKYNSNMITKEQMDEINFKNVLEANGYNLRNLYGNKERQKKLEKTRSRQSKEIKSLKKMLSELKEKQKATNIEGLNGTIESIDVGGDQVNKKKKKKKKSKGKGKKQKEMEKHFDRLILDAVGSDDKDMKSYEKRMKNMVWDQGGDE